jgi:peroxiredoxin
LVFDWPAPYVEFEQIPPNPNVHVGPGVILPEAPDYSALKTWIPGGTITQYQWSVQGQEQAYPFDVDPNRFVLLHSRTGVIDPVAMSTPVPGYAPLCLTITGSRISNYGSPIAYHPVTAYVCGVTKFHVGGLVGLSAGGSAVPMFAITRPGPGGEVVVSGHASAEIERSGRSAPNLIVHFADSKSVSQLQTLIQALHQSKRTDAPSAVIAALTRDQLSKARFASGIAYADDQDSWQTALGLKAAKPPLTLIVSPQGEIVWQHEGALEAGKLAAVLEKHLVKRGPVRVTVPRLNVRTGQPTPNFLFEYAPGREMPLSKLKRQPVILVFWRSSVEPSIAAVRDLQSTGASGKTPAPVVLAINDGEDPEVARTVAAESGITATVVTDPKREISEAYGVSLWPTIVTVGASGAVTGIRYGHLPGENVKSPSKPPSAGS